MDICQLETLQILKSGFFIHRHNGGVLLIQIEDCIVNFRRERRHGIYRARSLSIVAHLHAGLAIKRKIFLGGHPSRLNYPFVYR